MIKMSPYARLGISSFFGGNLDNLFYRASRILFKIPSFKQKMYGTYIPVIIHQGQQRMSPVLQTKEPHLATKSTKEHQKKNLSMRTNPGPKPLLFSFILF